MELSVEGVFESVEGISVVGCGDGFSAVWDSCAAGGFGFGSMVRVGVRALG